MLSRVIFPLRKESKKFLEQLIANSNETIYLRSYDVDKYGRVLGEIIIDGTSVGKTMMAEGHAVEYFGGKR